MAKTITIRTDADVSMLTENIDVMNLARAVRDISADLLEIAVDHQRNDRDVNAAINILSAASVEYGRGGTVRLVLPQTSTSRRSAKPPASAVGQMTYATEAVAALSDEQRESLRAKVDAACVGEDQHG